LATSTVNLPELHSLYVSLAHSPKRELPPIEYKFLVNGSRDRLFVELMYRNKTNEGRYLEVPKRV